MSVLADRLAAQLDAVERECAALRARLGGREDLAELRARLDAAERDRDRLAARVDGLAVSLGELGARLDVAAGAVERADPGAADVLRALVARVELLERRTREPRRSAVELPRGRERR